MSVNGSVLGATTAATGGAVLGVNSATGSAVLPNTGSNMIILIVIATLVVVALGILTRQSKIKYEEID